MAGSKEDDKNEDASQTEPDRDDAKDEGETLDVEAKEREEVEIFVRELNGKIQAKSQLRQENLKCDRPPEEYFSKLDSSLKKNTAFVKKMKQFTSTQLDTFLRDMSNLNLSKYISEICAALSEAKMKMSDVSPVVVLCSKLHQIYPDFSSLLLEAMQKSLTIKPGEKITNPSKMRVDLRFFAELVSSGIINYKPGLSFLGNLLTTIISQDKENHSNIATILSFCKHCGEEYAGLISKHIAELAKKYNIEIPRSTLLTPEKQQNLRNLLKDYFRTVCTHTITEHKEMRSMTRSIRGLMETKGEISNEKREKYESMQTKFEKFLTSARTLADLLGEELPELAEDQEYQSAGTVLDNIIEESYTGELDPWEDEESKNFYLDLPDLRQYLPNFSAPKQASSVENLAKESQITEEVLDMDIAPEQLEIEDPPTPADSQLMPPPEARVGTPELVLTKSDPPSATVSEAEEISVASGAQPKKKHTGSHNQKQRFDHFLHNLTNCVNKELIDSAAIEFLLNFNTKHNRKKLAAQLFGVPRTRLDLLPYFARFVAIINLVSRDIATDLANLLKNEFKWHLKKKNQMNIESKIKICRFIGEMVKFGLYPKIEALFCLKLLLHDFHHHQIEMACALLEVAGRFLYNNRETRLRTNVYLEQMYRLKTVTAFDSRHCIQIENAYYLIKPPEHERKTVKVRPIMHEYIRYVVFEMLNKTNVEKCIKIMRCLNWDDPEISNYACKCLSKAYLLRFPIIRWLADLISGLSSYQGKAMARVVDAVFEDIRAGLEIHSPKLAQRRVAMAKYLGELYNYKLVDHSEVLNTLYSIISLGISTEEGVYSALDPPDSLFRLKLACVLLDTCGIYFTNSSSRKRLDYFLVFFQHYYWYKKSHPIFSSFEDTSDLFPILIDHMYKDCLAQIRPKLKLFKSLEEAKRAIEKLKEELYPQLAVQPSSSETALVGSASHREGTTSASTEDALEAIPEYSEMDEVTDNSRDPRSDSRLRDLEDEDDVDIDESPIDQEEEKPKEPERTQEDIEFEQMFEKMAADCYQERLRENIKPKREDIPVPIMAKNSKKTYDQLKNKDGGTSDDAVPFVLMLRGSKGSKQQFKTFKAPSDSALAINLKLQEEKIREENEKVKRLTLNITERIEEEEYQEALLQSQKSQSSSRLAKGSRRGKYRHQKGAPDADLIFH